MRNSPGTQEITTEWLILRKFRSRDMTYGSGTLFKDVTVTGLLFGKEYADAQTIGSFLDGLQDSYANPQFFLWAIQLKNDEQVIGFLHGDYNENVNSIRLTYALEPAWRNRGYMKEAISAVIPYFMKEIQVNRIEAICDNQQRSAGKVLLHCGFFGEGIMRQAAFRNGETVDLISYAIVKDTYERIKKYEKITVDDLWITNYRENGGDYLKSITRLPKEEAVNFAEHLSSVTTSKNDRYGNYFVRYYAKRLKSEEWLYSQFQKHGGKPRTEHPIYFVLCDNPGLETFYGRQDAMCIKLKDIPGEYISFTPRDSMHLRDMGLLEGTVWNKDEIFGLLKNSGRGIGDMIVNLPGLYGQSGGYIEAHLWNDDYLKFAYTS